MKRTIFAIVNFENKALFGSGVEIHQNLLIRKQSDGHWFLPGCPVADEASDAAALVMAVKEQTGLEIQVEWRLHVEYRSGDELAVGYRCRMLGGDMRNDRRNISLLFVSQRCLYAGICEAHIRGYDESGMHTRAMDEDMRIPLPLAVEGRPDLHRLIWDAMSLNQTPLMDLMDDEKWKDKGEGIYLSDDSRSLTEVFPGHNRLMWSRIVPAKA